MISLIANSGACIICLYANGYNAKPWEIVFYKKNAYHRKLCTNSLVGQLVVFFASVSSVLVEVAHAWPSIMRDLTVCSMNPGHSIFSQHHVAESNVLIISKLYHIRQVLSNKNFRCKQEATTLPRNGYKRWILCILLLQITSLTIAFQAGACLRHQPQPADATQRT